MKELKGNELLHKTSQIRFFLTDCDGVLTDGGVYYGADGEVLKKFNIRDGMGVERLGEICSIPTGIITGEASPSVLKRADKLKIGEVHLSVKDKLTCVKEIAARHGIRLEEIAYIGDDVNDLEVLKVVGLSACPADAQPSVKAVCDYICRADGGMGAFREMAELIIESRT